MVELCVCNGRADILCEDFQWTETRPGWIGESHYLFKVWVWCDGCCYCARSVGDLVRGVRGCQLKWSVNYFFLRGRMYMFKWHVKRDCWQQWSAYSYMGMLSVVIVFLLLQWFPSSQDELHLWLLVFLLAFSFHFNASCATAKPAQAWEYKLCSRLNWK